MSAGFTKGPWLAGQGSGLGATTYVYEAGEDGKQKCAIAGCTLDYVERPFEEREANARLIAAAPSLYSDAEFLCARIRELEGELTGDDEASRQYFGHVLPAVARMESALAEARGEQVSA